MNNFDPYDFIMHLEQRLARLEQAHNKLAHAFEKTEQELNIALHSLRNLQNRHLAVVQKINTMSVPK